jgi:hypothetical protein
VNLSVLRAGGRSIPKKYDFLLLVLISVRGLVVPEELGDSVETIHLIWSRTSDLPGRSVVPEVISVCSAKYAHNLESAIVALRLASRNIQ